LIARCNFSDTSKKVQPESAPESEKVLPEENAPQDVAESEEPAAPIDDAYAMAVKAYEAAEREGKKLHGELLLRYADAENKRRERTAELKRRDAYNISAFGAKTMSICYSSDKTCELAEKKS